MNVKEINFNYAFFQRTIFQCILPNTDIRINLKLEKLIRNTCMKLHTCTHVDPSVREFNGQF